MNIKLPKRQDIQEEAMQLLWQHMPPSKVSLVISMWFSEGGNYLQTRDELFAEETVESLVTKIEAFESDSNGLSA